MTKRLGRFRLGLAGAALLTSSMCLHCGDDGSASSPPGEAGESSGGAEPGLGGGAPSEAGSGGTEPRPGGSGGVDTLPGGGVGGASELVPEGEHYGFVFDTMTLPSNDNQAEQSGLDLDGDDMVDNQFGKVLATLVGQGSDINGALTTLVQTGEVIMLADLQTTSFSNAAAVGFDTFYGTSPDPEPCAAADDCGHHLDGTGSFELTNHALGETCVGSIEAGAFSGTGGALPVRIALGAAPLDVTLHDARVELSELSEDGFSEGHIAGVISAEEIDSQIYPALHANLTASIALDCTGSPPAGCGCEAGSSGETMISLFDADADCDVTLLEVRESPLLQTLLSLDMDHDSDGTADGISFGFLATAKHATFDLP